MLSIQVSSLHIYPVKSTAGIELPQADINLLGLAFDRRFVLCNSQGQFITARTEPTLCLIQATLTTTGIEHSGIELTANGMPNLILNYKAFSARYKKVTVWDDEINSQVCSAEADRWFSRYLNRNCQLVFFGERSNRIKKPNTSDERSLAFTDGYPLLLISQASLDDLNQRLAQQNLLPVAMSQFRPNIVVNNCPAFAEDTWQHIRIGEIEFIVSKPCERCIFTTVNPKSGKKHPQQQPLATLRDYRKSDQGEVLFGQNLIPLNQGTIKKGDKVQVLSLQKPPVFSSVTFPTVNQVTIESKNLTNANKKVSIYFEKWQKKYQGDNQKTLLEHGEDAGLILPYSCLAGMCGCCKAKLVSGEVDQLNSDGLTEDEQQQGYILCCSSIAISDVVIAHNG